MNSSRNFLYFFFIFIGNCLALSDDYLMESAYKNELSQIKMRHEKTEYPELLYKTIETEVKFVLFTRKNRTGELLIPGDLYTYTISQFRNEKPTKILIHGYVDDITGPMITTITTSYLLAEDVNVIAVDWSNISMDLNYITVAMRSADVGHYLSDLIEFLIAQGADMNNFHIIGFSLGAHIAGTAGKTVKSGKIPRITGLDPALPGFSTLNLSYRLHDSDALFVDCIHTCGHILGLFEPICHANFYPNGGLHPQPGCPYFDFGKCSHFRSFYFYAESILEGHKFPVLTCNTINSESRDCYVAEGKDEIAMGVAVNNSTRGKFYVYTNSAPPYAPIRRNLSVTNE